MLLLSPYIYHAQIYDHAVWIADTLLVLALLGTSGAGGTAERILAIAAELACGLGLRDVLWKVMHALLGSTARGDDPSSALPFWSGVGADEDSDHALEVEPFVNDEGNACEAALRRWGYGRRACALQRTLNNDDPLSTVMSLAVSQVGEALRGDYTVKARERERLETTSASAEENPPGLVLAESLLCVMRSINVVGDLWFHEDEAIRMREREPGRPGIDSSNSPAAALSRVLRRQSRSAQKREISESTASLTFALVSKELEDDVDDLQCDMMMDSDSATYGGDIFHQDDEWISPLYVPGLGRITVLPVLWRALIECSATCANPVSIQAASLLIGVGFELVSVICQCQDGTIKSKRVLCAVAATFVLLLDTIVDAANGALAEESVVLCVSCPLLASLLPNMLVLADAYCNSVLDATATPHAAQTAELVVNVALPSKGCVADIVAWNSRSAAASKLVFGREVCAQDGCRSHLALVWDSKQNIGPQICYRFTRPQSRAALLQLSGRIQRYSLRLATLRVKGTINEDESFDARWAEDVASVATGFLNRASLVAFSSPILVPGRIFITAPEVRVPLREPKCAEEICIAEAAIDEPLTNALAEHPSALILRVVDASAQKAASASSRSYLLLEGDGATSDECARLHEVIFGDSAADSNKISRFRAAKLDRIDRVEAARVVAAVRAAALRAAGGAVLHAFELASAGNFDQCGSAEKASLCRIWMDAARRIRKWMLSNGWPNRDPPRVKLHGRLALLRRLCSSDRSAAHYGSDREAELRAAAAVAFICSAADPDIVEELLRCRGAFHMRRRAAVASIVAVHEETRGATNASTPETARASRLAMSAQLLLLSGAIRKHFFRMALRQRSLRSMFAAQSLSVGIAKTSQKAEETHSAVRIWSRVDGADNELMGQFRDFLLEQAQLESTYHQSGCDDALCLVSLGNYVSAITTSADCLHGSGLGGFGAAAGSFVTKAWQIVFPHTQHVRGSGSARFFLDAASVMWSAVQYKLASDIAVAEPAGSGASDLVASATSAFEVHRMMILGSIRPSWGGDRESNITRVLWALEATANLAIVCSEKQCFKWFTGVSKNIDGSPGSDAAASWIGTLVSVATSAFSLPLEQLSTVPLQPLLAASALEKDAAVDGWVCSQDPTTEEWYYWHPQTRASRRTLPRGWERHLDPTSGHSYYWHPESQKKQWNLPPMKESDALESISGTQVAAQALDATTCNTQAMGVLRTLCMRLLGRVLTSFSSVSHELTHVQRSAVDRAINTVWGIASLLPGIDAYVEAGHKNTFLGSAMGTHHLWEESLPAVHLKDAILLRPRISASMGIGAGDAIGHDNSCMFVFGKKSASDQIDSTAAVVRVVHCKVSSHSEISRLAPPAVVFGATVIAIGDDRHDTERMLRASAPFETRLLFRDIQCSSASWKTWSFRESHAAGLAPPARTMHGTGLIRLQLAMVRALLLKSDCGDQFHCIRQATDGERCTCLVVCGGVAVANGEQLHDCWLLILDSLRPIFNGAVSPSSSAISPCWLRLPDLPRHMCTLQICALDDQLWALVAFDDNVNAAGLPESAKPPRLSGYIGEQLVSLRIGENVWAAPCETTEWSLVHPDKRGTMPPSACTVSEARPEDGSPPRGGGPPSGKPPGLVSTAPQGAAPPSSAASIRASSPPGGAPVSGTPGGPPTREQQASSGGPPTGAPPGASPPGAQRSSAPRGGVPPARRSSGGRGPPPARRSQRAPRGPPLARSAAAPRGATPVGGRGARPLVRRGSGRGTGRGSPPPAREAGLHPRPRPLAGRGIPLSRMRLQLAPPEASTDDFDLTLLPPARATSREAAQSSPPTTMPIFDPASLEVGDLVDVLDLQVNDWYRSIIRVARDSTVRIHYEGWSSRYDEDILRSSSRLAMFGSRSIDAERQRSLRRASAPSAPTSSSSGRTHSATTSARQVKLFSKRLRRLQHDRLLLADSNGQLHILRCGRNRYRNARKPRKPHPHSLDHVIVVPVSFSLDSGESAKDVVSNKTTLPPLLPVTSSTVLISRGSREKLPIQSFGIGYSSLSFGGAHFADGNVVVCFIPSELSSGTATKLGPIFFQRRLSSTLTLQDAMSWRLQKNSTASEAIALLQALAVSPGGMTDVPTTLFNAISNAPKLFDGFAHGMVKSPKRSEAASTADALLPSMPNALDTLRDLFTALSVMGGIVPSSPRNMMSKLSEASSCNSTALQSTRQEPAANVVVIIESEVARGRPFACASVVASTLGARPNGARENAVLSEIVLLGAPGRKSPDSLAKMMSIHAVDSTGLTNWLDLVPKLVRAAALATEGMRKDQAACGAAYFTGSSPPPSRKESAAAGGASKGCGHHRFALCNRLAAGILRLVRKMLTDSHQDEDADDEDTPTLNLLKNTEVMNLLVAVAIPALRIASKLRQSVDWRGRDLRRMRCRSVMWQRLMKFGKPSEIDNIFHKHLGLPLLKPMEAQPWTVRDWSGSSSTNEAEPELRTFYESCFPPGTIRFSPTGRPPPKKKGKKKKGKRRHSAPGQSPRSSPAESGWSDLGVGGTAAAAEQWVAHGTTGSSSLLPLEQSATFITAADDAKTETSGPQGIAFTLRGMHPSVARSHAPQTTQLSLLRAAHFEDVLQRWSGAGCLCEDDDQDELWRRMAILESEIVSFEAAHLLASLLPHSRVATPLPKHLSQTPAHILALGRLTMQSIESFMPLVSAVANVTRFVTDLELALTNAAINTFGSYAKKIIPTRTVHEQQAKPPSGGDANPSASSAPLANASSSFPPSKSAQGVSSGVASKFSKRLSKIRKKASKVLVSRARRASIASGSSALSASASSMQGLPVTLKAPIPVSPAPASKKIVALAIASDSTRGDEPLLRQAFRVIEVLCNSAAMCISKSGQFRANEKCLPSRCLAFRLVFGKDRKSGRSAILPPISAIAQCGRSAKWRLRAVNLLASILRMLCCAVSTSGLVRKLPRHAKWRGGDSWLEAQPLQLDDEITVITSAVENVHHLVDSFDPWLGPLLTCLQRREGGVDGSPVGSRLTQALLSLAAARDRILEQRNFIMKTAVESQVYAPTTQRYRRNSAAAAGAPPPLRRASSNPQRGFASKQTRGGTSRAVHLRPELEFAWELEFEWQWQGNTDEAITVSPQGSKYCTPFCAAAASLIDVLEQLVGSSAMPLAQLERQFPQWGREANSLRFPPLREYLHGRPDLFDIVEGDDISSDDDDDVESNLNRSPSTAVSSAASSAAAPASIGNGSDVKDESILRKLRRKSSGFLEDFGLMRKRTDTTTPPSSGKRGVVTPPPMRLGAGACRPTVRLTWRSSHRACPENPPRESSRGLTSSSRSARSGGSSLDAPNSSGRIRGDFHSSIAGVFSRRLSFNSALSGDAESSGARAEAARPTNAARQPRRGRTRTLSADDTSVPESRRQLAKRLKEINNQWSSALCFAALKRHRDNMQRAADWLLTGGNAVLDLMSRLERNIVTISVTPKKLFARQPFTVNFDFTSPGERPSIRSGAWIGIFKVGEPDVAALRRGTFVTLSQQQYEDGVITWEPAETLVMPGDDVEQHSGQGQLPDEPGKYELRFFSCAGAESPKVGTSVAIVVERRPVEPNAVRRLEAWLRQLEQEDKCDDGSTLSRLETAQQLIAAAVESAGLACQPDPVDRISESYTVGQAVSGNYLSRGRWYPARILSGGVDGMWDVIYDDDQIVEILAETHLRERVVLGDGAIEVRAPASTRGHISSRKASRSAMALLERLTHDPNFATDQGGFVLHKSSLGPALGLLSTRVLKQRLRCLARLNALIQHVLPSVDLMRLREDKWSLSALLARCKSAVFPHIKQQFLDSVLCASQPSALESQRPMQLSFFRARATAAFEAAALTPARMSPFELNPGGLSLPAAGEGTMVFQAIQGLRRRICDEQVFSVAALRNPPFGRAWRAYFVGEGACCCAHSSSNSWCSCAHLFSPAHSLARFHS